MALLELTDYEEILKMVIEAAKNGESDILYLEDKLTDSTRKRLKLEGFVIDKDSFGLESIKW